MTAGRPLVPRREPRATAAALGALALALALALACGEPEPPAAARRPSSDGECDLAAPFGQPRGLALPSGSADGTGLFGRIALTGDELTAVVVDEDGAVHLLRRSERTADFGQAVPLELEGLDAATVAPGGQPSLSLDGRHLYLVANGRLWLGERVTEQRFAFALLPKVYVGVGQSSWLSADERTAFGDFGLSMICRRLEDAWTCDKTAVPAGPLSTDGSLAYEASLSADPTVARALLERTTTLGRADWDLKYPLGEPVRVGLVDGYPNWVSANGCRIYGRRYRPAGWWVVERPK